MKKRYFLGGVFISLLSFGLAIAFIEIFYGYQCEDRGQAVKCEKLEKTKYFIEEKERFIRSIL